MQIRITCELHYTQDISGFSALNEFFSQQGGDGLGTLMSLVNMYFQQVRTSAISRDRPHLLTKDKCGRR